MEASALIESRDLVPLPPVNGRLRDGHVFGPELFELLDDFHLPITIQDFWDGKFVKILWINKRFVEVTGDKTRQARINGINAAGANPTETFVRRAKMWKELVQLDLGMHTDPHKLFPDNKPPIPHYTRKRCHSTRRLHARARALLPARPRRGRGPLQARMRSARLTLPWPPCARRHAANQHGRVWTQGCVHPGRAHPGELRGRRGRAPGRRRVQVLHDGSVHDPGER